jgi:hypothetical protein
MRKKPSLGESKIFIITVFVCYYSLNPTEVTQLYKSVADEAQTDLIKIVNQSQKS